MQIPEFSDVLAAANRIRGHAVETPLLPLPGDGRLFVKAENLQRTGSFKFRGAFNRLSLIPEADRAAGVVACSSGNHAQGVAAAAAILGMPATIVMPSDAPGVKVTRTRGHGAEVVFYDRERDDRDAIAAAIAARTGATLVHPYNDAGVIAGQGTVGLEIARQMKARGLVPDAVLVCTGGGGLTAGVALSLEAEVPACAVHTVEPAGFDDHRRSFEAGERVRNQRLSGSLCDALMANTPGEIGFEINRRRITSGLVVTDEEALAAMAYAVGELKLILEPGGAVALAALLNRRIETEGRTIVAVLSGGNVDPPILARALA